MTGGTVAEEWRTKRGYSPKAGDDYKTRFSGNLTTYFSYHNE